MKNILVGLLPFGVYPCKMLGTGGLYFGLLVWWMGEQKFIRIKCLKDTSKDL